MQIVPEVSIANRLTCSDFTKAPYVSGVFLSYWFTGCPKVRVNFEVPGFSLICWPIPKPFGMVNPHKLRFGLVYNKPCNVLLTSREYGIKFEKILKEEKRWKFWHKGFFEMFMDSGTPCMLKKLLFIILRCTPIEICLTWERENGEKLDSAVASGKKSNQLCFESGY